MSDYIDLNVEIAGNPGSFTLKGTTDKLGIFHDTFEPPFLLGELDLSLIGPHARRGGSMIPIDAAGKASPKSPTEIGEAMFESLFSGRLGKALERVTATAVERGAEGVRIRLNFNLNAKDMPQLAALPWELMRKPGDSPLAVSTKTVLVRSLDVEDAENQKPPGKEVRVLLISSNPTGTDALDLEQESNFILAMLQRMKNVTVDAVLPRSKDIKQALRDHQYQVVHYMGHGEFNADEGGVLTLENDDGTPRSVTARTFSTWLQSEPLQLVFLNACYTGTTPDVATQHPFAGLAASLVKLGVPAVVAMQFPITDESALDFARIFYAEISRDQPVDKAVSAARMELFEDNNVEWATPVLYMRAGDGMLFKTVDGSEDKLAEPLPEPRPAPVQQAPDPAPAPQVQTPNPAPAPQLLVAAAPAGNIWQRQNLYGKIGLVAILILAIIVLAVFLSEPPPTDEAVPMDAAAEAAPEAEAAPADEAVPAADAMAPEAAPADEAVESAPAADAELSADPAADAAAAEEPIQ